MTYYKIYTKNSAGVEMLMADGVPSLKLAYSLIYGFERPPKTRKKYRVIMVTVDDDPILELTARQAKDLMKKEYIDEWERLYHERR